MNAEAIRGRAAVDQWPSPRRGPSRPWRGAVFGGDVLALGAIVFAIPFVILAIGLPIALVAQLLLWIGRML